MRGFTLIELLIVIGIIGILAAVVLVGIDPLDKINSANDSKVQRDINAIATAVESYAATNNGCYNLYTAPTCTATLLAPADLVTAGELKVALVAPGGYTAYTNNSPSGTQGRWYGQLKSKKYTATPFLVWCSDSGRAGPTATAITCP